ncbi:NUDIX domain-containing protein [Rossellomorea marisflavi]|uniref:NUDIX hydrolase n=2 Tax=Rossellomorea marisflavi TaxID=189381 RepID=UPI0027A35A11|nr:NUDIX domain-containing protein [Rossellomorea marisflavi]UTE74880.1 NUDIX domain-containing protein [Rossellomorea marisflavi]
MDHIKELRKRVGHRPLILAGAVVIILNQHKEILLQQRTDDDWGLPGGLLELGESLEAAAIREVKEETGLEVGQLQLLGIHSGEDYYFKLANQDELYSVTAVYEAGDVRGRMEKDGSESIDLKYFSLLNLPLGLTDEYLSYITPYLDRLLADIKRNMEE